jgi:hypothetical protein
MNTNTHTARHMARPSRLRVMRARVIAWHDEHRDDIAAALIVPPAVVVLAALFSFALVSDGRATDAVAVACVIVLVSALAAALAWIIADTRADEKGTRRVNRAIGNAHALVSELTTQRDDLAAALSATQASLRVSQDGARHLRAELARYASSLVDMALNDDDDDALTLAVRVTYYDERYTATASLNGVDIAQGVADYADHADTDAARRHAALDALDNAAFELSVAASVLNDNDTARAVGLTANPDLVQVLKSRDY